jgi:RNA polymerase sigma factor (sigma-70 family)
MDDSYKELPGKDKSELLITGKESSLATGRRSDKIRKAIDELSDQQKTAVVLKFFHGKTSVEIGEIMECSDATVRTHIYRAMKNLKHLLHDLKTDE